MMKMIMVGEWWGGWWLLNGENDDGGVFSEISGVECFELIDLLG